MNYRNTLIAAAAAALVPLAGTAVAAEHGTKSGASFDTLDTNRDGRISRAEASADANIVFAQADANGDGYLDTMEYSDAQKMRSGDSNSNDTTSPQPQSDSQYPSDASGQQTEPVDPQSPETTPPTDTETPRQ
jgi:EF hand